MILGHADPTSSRRSCARPGRPFLRRADLIETELPAGSRSSCRPSSSSAW
jgi:hypothetical protein